MTSISDLKDAIVNKCTSLISSHNTDNTAHNLSTVARSGSYNDLSDKPSGLIVDQSLDSSSTNAVANQAVVGGLNNKADVGHTHDWITIGAGSFGTLRYNPEIRLCIFKYARDYNFTSQSSALLGSNVVASGFRPNENMVGFCTNPNHTGYINSSGDVYGRSSATGNQSFNLTVIFNY